MKRTMGSLFVLAVLFFVFAAVVFAGEIHEAAKSGDIAKLRSLLDKDPALLYAKDEMGKTPLHWTVGRGQIKAMKVLLDEYHVNVDVRNDNQGTPLHVAASQAQPEAAKILIAHGATVNARTKNGSTPLHFAAYKGRKPGHIETAKILIENGADVNAKIDNGATPLSMAMSRGNNEIVALLRAHGAKEVSGRQGMIRNQKGQQGMMQQRTQQGSDNLPGGE
ncbi:MAG TPA: ankyrin repeat domain-containing protein [Candidatus Omnitrophota bacterium]|nr:ankyrin repeat domain-containing protein [Candidatus Omnitrophota bacterium]HPD84826.1 ankyrin repeat domain-containing protein [Candidatus Omnitrophota bacterium]HRZ03684.1 ankyrin repeat domain-containing protein [Candidatus Omnitrophota bacterium]